jgi:membrane-associated phospholipid phosphatase
MIKSLPLIVCFLFLSKVNCQNADIDLLKKINGRYTISGGKTMIFITKSDNPVAFGLPAVLFITGIVKKDKGMIWNSGEMMTATLMNGVVTASMKLGFDRPRPSVTYPNDIVKYTKAGSHSFPSGHTSMAFATATSISLMYPKWYVIAPAYTWATAVGYSRLYLGVHYPSDVLVGAIIGSASSVGAQYLFRFLKNKYQKKESKI